MTDQQLINKVYYENLIGGRDGHPVGVLGSLYLEENHKEIPDLSYIRFAQGEVYFHEKDFEAAIFKWENIGNDLEAWARKNMADAYMELGLPETAEGIYLSIESESTALKIETGLQLLSIYMLQGKKQQSTDIVQSIVALDPDYPQLTEIARSYYEEQGDWHNAVRLSVDEGIRKRSTEWFDRLIAYVEEGRTSGEEPAFFDQALVSLYEVDANRFEQLAAALWRQYRANGTLADWLKNFNALFSGMEADRSQQWLGLSALYQESYFELINGDSLLKDISPLVPLHLENWLKIASPATELFASSSVLAWNEMFPSTLAGGAIREAEEVILNARRYPSAKVDSLELFDSLLSWGKRNGVDAGNRMKWIVNELADEETNHVIVAGTKASGKAKFLNQILGQNLLSPQTSSVIAFRHGDETNIREISDEDIKELENEAQFNEASGKGLNPSIQETIIETAFPEQFLRDNRLVIMDIPATGLEKREKTPLYQYVNFADSLLFMLDPEDLLSVQEQDILMEISRMAPDLPVHFIVTRDGGMVSEDGLEGVLAKIRMFYPHARLFVHSRNLPVEVQKREFADFVHSGLKRSNRVDERIMKLQYYIRTAINYLLDKRIIMENDLVEKVRWNEEMVSKLRGAIHQLQDLEDENKRDVKAGYLSIKDSLRAEMLKNIPVILKGTSDIVKEDSDFANIHSKLEKEMNERVQAYMETTILREYYRALQEWIASSRGEFSQAQSNLDELSQGFNVMYGEERIALQCDFRVLDDWERDADRMTSGIQMDRVQFLGKFTAGQFLLKSAGKLLSVLPQNKAMLYNKYKSFLENEDYRDRAEDVATRFFKQFEIFEKAIDRDVSLFFRDPLKELNAAVEDARDEISRSEKALEQMRINPEVYRDPLNLYEVKLRQYEWMAAAGKQEQTSSS